MNKRNKLYASIFLFVVLFLWSNAYSQGVYVPIKNEVYSFINRINAKGVINYSKLVLPLTRIQVSEYIREIESHSFELSEVEREELSWYKRDYYDELNENREISELNYLFLENAVNKRRHFFYYKDSIFVLKLNPNIGYILGNKYSELQTKQWGGISLYGSVGENIGFSLDFRDNTETGEKTDRVKNFSDITGIQIIGGKGNSIEYSEVRGAITYESNYFNLSIGKDWFNWGSGYKGRLILSEKAPSFPFVRLDIKPAKWLNFYYIHGWLNSRVIDSAISYNTILKIDSSFQRRWIERDKFYAAHIVEIIPSARVKVSLGESVIYSDQGPKIGYLIPVAFFRLVDHYYEGNSGFGKGGNSQFFLDLNLKPMNGLVVYSTLFIDEFSLTNLLKGKNDRNQLGYTIGLQNYGSITNLNIIAEYTRILPWVYSNFIQTQTYTNSNYLLGHYIGQNADQIYLQFDYRLFRGLEFKLWGEIIRQGGFEDISKQYSDPGEPFLYGLRRNESNIGFDVRYEYIHDLFAEFNYKYSDISDEDALRTPEFMLGRQHSFSVGVGYGL